MELREFKMAIRTGQLDEELSGLQDLITARLADKDGPDVRWSLTLGDLSVSEDDLTLQECFDWETRANVPWSLLKPTISAHIAQALLVTVLISRQGMSEDDAVAKVGEFRAQQVMAAIGSYVVGVDDEDPLDPSDDGPG